MAALQPFRRPAKARRRSFSCAPRSIHASRGCSAQPDGVASATPSTNTRAVSLPRLNNSCPDSRRDGGQWVGAPEFLPANSLQAPGVGWSRWHADNPCGRWAPPKSRSCPRPGAQPAIGGTCSWGRRLSLKSQPVRTRPRRWLESEIVAGRPVKM